MRTVVVHTAAALTFALTLASPATSQESNEIEPPDALCDVGSAGSDLDAIRRVVLAHMDAINRGDAEVIDDQHTADAGGFLTETRARVMFQAPPPLLAAAFEGARPDWTVRELRIQLLGDVGVASFYMDGSVTRADGSVDNRPRRVTEVWVCRGGAWKEAHHHDDPLGPSGADL